MTIQSFDWGYINWIYESNVDGNASLNIGISYMNPKSIQGSHIHYGDEQILYILSGEGIQYINGEKHIIQKNKWFKIDIGSSHETINTGDKEIMKLLISFPMKNKTIHRLNLNSIYYDPLYLSEIIPTLEIDENFNFPITILSDDYDIIYKPNNYGDYCNNCCNINIDPLSCQLSSNNTGDKIPEYSFINSYKCSYGVNVFKKPIVYNEKLLGYLLFGYIKDSSEVYNKTNIPKSTISGMLSSIDKFVENILDLYEQKLTTEMLYKHTLDINKYLHQEKEMEKSLSSLENEMISIKINNHFLFNTLNAIASLSLKGDKFKTYKSILGLSRLLRYSVEKRNEFVNVSDELDYIKDYISLQRIRYDKAFSTKYTIDDLSLQYKVPFNILQPIVENIFIHSQIMSKDNVKIRISIELKDNFLLISISDNAIGIEKNKLKNLLNSFTRDNDESGLNMVYDKLYMIYKDQFTMTINSEKFVKTEVFIKLPTGEKYEKSNNS